MYYTTILTEVLEKFSQLLKDFIRSRSHETGTKSINREHFVLVIILYIIDVDIGTSEQHMLTKAILKKKIAWQGE